MIVVIPALNPDFHLTNLVNELKTKTKYKIIVVNDGSNSDEIFAKLPKSVAVLTHEVNKGKGAAFWHCTISGCKGACREGESGTCQEAGWVKIKAEEWLPDWLYLLCTSIKKG